MRSKDQVMLEAAYSKILMKESFGPMTVRSTTDSPVQDYENNIKLENIFKKITSSPNLRLNNPTELLEAGKQALSLSDNDFLLFFKMLMRKLPNVMNLIKIWKEKGIIFGDAGMFSKLDKAYEAAKRERRELNRGEEEDILQAFSDAEEAKISEEEKLKLLEKPIEALNYEDNMRAMSEFLNKKWTDFYDGYEDDDEMGDILNDKY